MLQQYFQKPIKPRSFPLFFFFFFYCILLAGFTKCDYIMYLMVHERICFNIPSSHSICVFVASVLFCLFPGLYAYLCSYLWKSYATKKLKVFYQTCWSRSNKRNRSFQFHCYYRDADIANLRAQENRFYQVMTQLYRI